MNSSDVTGDLLKHGVSKKSVTDDLVGHGFYSRSPHPLHVTGDLVRHGGLK